MALPSDFRDMGGKYLIAFLFCHGLIFIGVGYIVSFHDPWFSIMHSGGGIFTYLIFLLVVFQKHFIKAFIGAACSMAMGWYFGDFFVDHFYLGTVKDSLGHRIYASMILFYLYLFFDLVLLVLRVGKQQP